MKKQFNFFAILCILLLALVGCNTTKEQGTSSTEGTNAGNDNIAKEEQPTEPNDESELQTNSITYTTNGVQKTEETTTINSDAQQYSIQILPSFTLTSEEPGKDLLYLTENDSVSMRIEHLSINNTSFQELLKNTEEMMNAVDENVTYSEFDMSPYLNNQTNIINYAAYKVDLVDEVVISVVFEKDDQLVRLTIYDEPSVNLTDAMIKMGLTISKN